MRLALLEGSRDLGMMCGWALPLPLPCFVDMVEEGPWLCITLAWGQYSMGR